MTQKINSECLNQDKGPSIIDENYFINNHLPKNIPSWKAKFVLKRYFEEIGKMLVENGSYCLSNENTGMQSRLISFIRVRRTEENLKPRLILDFENAKGSIGGQKVKTRTLPEFQEKLDSIAVENRYKYPKA